MLLGAGMNSNWATSRTVCLPSHGDENIPVGGKMQPKGSDTTRETRSIQMACDFIQNGLLVPTTVFLWIFSNLAKEFIHMILIKISFEKGEKKAQSSLKRTGLSELQMYW